MPYCAPSVNGAQCQAYSWDPSARGFGCPAQPGISSLVRRGAKAGLTSLNLTSCIAVFPVAKRHLADNRLARAEKSQLVKEFHAPAQSGCLSSGAGHHGADCLIGA